MTTSKLTFLSTLENLIADRKASPSPTSYTSELFAAGTQRIAQKVGEEAVELALASCHDNRAETIAESADLIYHLLVLLANQEIPLSEVLAALEARHRPS